MTRLLAALFFVAVLPALCPAVEIDNIRPRYGPFGAVREGKLKCVHMDVLVITYDLSGLAVDKAGKAKYVTLLELVDSKNTVIFSKETPNEPVLQLGGSKMPGDLFVQVGAKQAPGKYTIRLTVTDKLEKNANIAAKKFEYPYEVLGEKFGLAGVSAPAFGIVGTRYVPEFAVANFTLDKKGQPKAEVNIRLLDEKGNQLDTVKYSLPADLPESVDLAKLNLAPFQYPLYLNRAGRFSLEITAEDKLGNTKTSLSYPFTVMDINSVAK